MTQVLQASCKAVLLVLLVLLVAGRAAETSEKQEEDQMEERGQNQADVMTLLKSLQARLSRVENQRMILIRGKPGKPGPRGYRGYRGYRGPGGVQYVRWGRTTCPWGASLVYKGHTGGERYNHPGGAANYVCLPKNPRYRRYRNGYQNTAFIYGTQYELYLSNPFTRNYGNHDAPCAVCYVPTRSAKMMIPATYECPAGWTREYHGYLMTAGYDHKHSSELICVDENIEPAPGSYSRHRNGATLYPVEGVCGTLPCRPYVGGRELTCAVCTK